MAIDSVKELWEQICEDCRINNKITEVGLKVWLTDITPKMSDDGVLMLYTNNEYKKKTIDMYYKKILEQSCEAVSGLPMNIDVVIKTEVKEKEEIKDEDYTFENFVVGSSNKFAHAAAMAVAENPSSNKFNPLFLYGNSGVGKTHLMNAIKNSIEKNFPEKKVLCLRGEQFMNELINAFRNQTTDLFHERFRSVDALLIDDIHFIAGKDVAQEEFFNTFNALYPVKQIVVTSDRPPKEIKTLEERIRSRFESGMLVDMSPPDFETRISILRNKAIQYNLNIDDDILYYIAEQIKTNIRQLEGIIKKLNAYSMVDSGKISLPLIQKYIHEVVNETMPEPITVDKIVTEVSRTYNVSVEDIYSKKKSSDIAFARQVAIYVVNNVLEMSSIEIGKNFNKDHTTILYTVNKIKDIMATDEFQKKLIDDIIKNIKS